MISLKDNRGLTLLELLATIAIGSLITLAATTVLLLGLRIHKQSTETATLQNQVRIGITVIEEMVKESSASEAENLFAWDGTDQVLRVKESNGVILENVLSYSMEPEKESPLMIVTLKIGKELPGEEYILKIYPRKDEEPAAEGSSDSGAFSSENVLEAAVSNRELTPQVRTFLKTLASQMGSTGRILTEDGEGEFFSQWYIGSYADNPGWSEETPWCACYISWALEECSGYLEGEAPRFANVDSFWVEFVTTDRWKTEDPRPGDVIFFDWVVDSEKNAQHVGVVLAVENGWIYTVEGNSNGRVAVCRYAQFDARIMGYGVLEWT